LRSIASPLAALVSHETPHLVQIRRFYLLPQDHLGLHRSRVGYLPEAARGFSRFFKVSLTFCFDIFSTRAVSRIPDALAAMFIAYDFSQRLTRLLRAKQIVGESCHSYYSN